MISDIRDFVTTQLLSIDSGYKEWRDALNYANIPATTLNKTWHLSYSLGSITRVNAAEQYQINFSLRIFNKGNKDTVTSFDTLFDRAETIKNQIVAITNYGDTYAMIECNTIDIESISDNNDNKMIATLTFVATKFNAICGG